MGRTLVVIEAPNKRSKLAKILGSSYNIQASVGHILSIENSGVGNMGIDLETFTPSYEISEGKKKVVKDLKSEYKSCDDILIATDDDREGSFIAWSIAKELKLKNPRRIIFHAITEKEIKEAIKKPVFIDDNLVDAQKARSMLDKIVGFSISSLLWNTGCKSAGRVQSPVVRLICEKENDIKDFFEKDTRAFFKTVSEFDKRYKAMLYTNRVQKVDSDEDEDNEENKDKDVSKNSKLQVAKISSKDDMITILQKIGKSTFTVENIIEKESTRQPSPPFTTDSMIQDAHRRLGMSTQRVTSAAQNLYAAGYITYIRTDSPSLSEAALGMIEDYVKDQYGEKYHRRKQYATKSKNAQEAHEAIRPTDVNVKEIIQKEKCGADEAKLYRLIWKRSVASQMAPAKFKVMTIEIDISKLKYYKFVTEHEYPIFDGFLAVYNIFNEEEEDDEENESDKSSQDKDKKKKKFVLPEKGRELEIANVVSTQEYKKPPARYDDGSIIGKMKKIGIGRPATYNSAIKTIQDREYVVIGNNPGVEKKSLTLKLQEDLKNVKEESKTILLGKDSKKLVPTERGKYVTQFLLDNFPEIIDYEFTAKMEDKLDDVASGDVKMVKMMKNFYQDFKPLLDKVKKEIPVNKTKNTTELGLYPNTKNKIMVIKGPKGPYIQLLDENDKKINSASISEPLTMENITIKDAVKLLAYPKDLGTYKNEQIKLCKGPYGFYLKYGTINVTLGKEESDYSDFTLEDAKKRIEEKDKQIAEKKSDTLWEGKDKTYVYVVRKGPYGDYINKKSMKKKGDKGTNCKIPSNVSLKDMTVDRINEIIKNSFDYKKKFTKKDGNDKKEAKTLKSKTTKKKKDE